MVTALVLALAAGGLLYMESFELRYDHSYDLAEIVKYKTPTRADTGKVTTIAENLPLPDQYYSFVGVWEDNPDKIPIVRYQSESSWVVSWLLHREGVESRRKQDIEMIAERNALTMFVMIDDLTEVRFVYVGVTARDIGLGKQYLRPDLEAEYGVDLSVLGSDLDRLEEILNNK